MYCGQMSSLPNTATIGMYLTNVIFDNGQLLMIDSFHGHSRACRRDFRSKSDLIFWSITISNATTNAKIRYFAKDITTRCNPYKVDVSVADGQ